MSINRKDRIRKKRRVMRVRGNLKKGELPRVTVFRSLKHLYGQLIDDQAGTTLVSSSSLKGDMQGDKKAVAHAVGVSLAKQIKDKGIDQVLFDRGPYRYHGRVQAFADGLREGGVRI